MAPVFDAYVMVDWCAESRPKTGADSVWYCCLERRNGGFVPERIVNPATRREAVDALADLLSDLVARDRVTLVGFDFAFGYPAGFAERLRPDTPTWRGVWKEVSSRIRDRDDNTNNRFAVAAELNHKISGGRFPFWGCPKGQVGPNLSATRSGGYGPESLAEYRMTDRVATGPQPVWKLAYGGSVGSQTLLGIAHLFALRHHPWIAESTRVWPFETGMTPLERPGAHDWRVLFAEIYPSMIAAEPGRGEVRDQAQVRSIARHFASFDDHGAMAPLFAGPAELGKDERILIEREEGWILGIESSAPQTKGTAAAYLRNPDEIYRRSFAIIRAEADLARLPREMENVAIRLIHACGMPDLINDLAFSADAAAMGARALKNGAPILVDTEMVASGIIRRRLPAENPVLCTLGRVRNKGLGTTRSAAAVDLWMPYLDGAVVAIGNAPTALFRLLDVLREGGSRPALILGFPVGFVGAAESKEALITHPARIPYLAVRGRRGGSAMAAAAVNALANGSS